MEVFLRRGHERAAHALALQAQHHDDVGAAQAFAHVARGLDPEALDACRHQRRRCDHAHPRAQRIEQEPTDMFMTSAPSRLPASSKEACVRVETSKNKLMSVRPRSETCFLSIWRLRSTKCSARSSSPKISSRESPSIPNRSRWLRTKVDF